MHVEKTITEIWKSSLKVDQIDKSDNFFDLGGHSLMALIINGKINKEMGLDVPLRYYFEAKTFEEFLHRVTQLG